jgi:peptide/nickel transport system substrate-binding protein
MLHPDRLAGAAAPAVLLCALLAGCGGPRDEAAAPGEPAAGATAPQAPAGAPAQAEAGQPVRGDWLVIHLLADPENLNPYTSNDEGASRVLSWIFQSLLSIDPETLEQIPVLARELPQVSEDHLHYTFRLRDDVAFSDGTPLSAADVVTSLKIIRHPKVAAPHLRNYYESVQDAVALDPHTVRIDLREVYFRNRWILGAFEVLPRHYYDPENLLEGISVAELNAWEGLDAARKQRAERFAKRFNEDFQRNPLGSGAFALLDPERDFVTGERIVLRHRDDFWGAGVPDLGDAWVDRVVFRTINDREAALVALKSGELDFIDRITPLQAVRQTDDARFRERFGKHAEVRGAYTYVGWNLRRPIFSDVRVRHALSHLVDKQNLVDKVMLGLAEPVEGPIFRARPEFNDRLPPWEYSPEKARALLAEAGWSDGDGDGILDKEIDGRRVPLRFEIISNAGNDERKKVGLAVIDSFKQHGIDASFRSVDWSILLEKVGKFDYDAVILGWTSGTAALPPDAYQIFHSSQAVEEGSNHVGFVNEEADRILAAYRVEFDEARRKELYDRFQEIVYQEQPYTFLYAPSSVAVWDRRFSGVRWHPGIGTELNEWWVPAAQRKY